MSYIIDGHNLIPKLPGLSLQVVDDEVELIRLLQEFCRRHRKQVEVYFDRGAIGQPRKQRFGAVTARFVRQGMTADQAIRNRLQKLGRDAHNWTVVSSDLAVQNYARMAHAHFLSAEAFARELSQEMSTAPVDPGENADIQLDDQDLDDWLALFGKNAQDDG